MNRTQSLLGRILSLGVPALAASGALLASACNGANMGTQGSSAVSHIAVTGTVYTILFENHDEGAVENSSVPYFDSLAKKYGSADAYTGATHPSLPNYIMLTSGQTNGVGNDGPPADHPIAGNANLADQLDAAKVPWRAYMESMGSPCKLTDDGDYIVHHNPWVYYSSLSSDKARCDEHVVDFDQNFAADLAADKYKYVWITPNVCNDMHNCDPKVSDAWLQKVIPQIQASPGYKNNGAIFVLFDEGSLDVDYALRKPQNLAAIVISPMLVESGFHSTTAYSHPSYLATMEDIFSLPRLPTTTSATPMSDFFGTVPLNSPALPSGSSSSSPTAAQ